MMGRKNHKRKHIFPIIIVVLALSLGLNGKALWDGSTGAAEQARVSNSSSTATEEASCLTGRDEETTEPGHQTENGEENAASMEQTKESSDSNLSISPVCAADIPSWNGKGFIEINNNIPYFKDSVDWQRQDIYYSPLDKLGRCGVCYAYLSMETLAREERGEIGQFRPSGWHTVKYPDLIEDRYLYNRCHLLGFQLLGKESNNERNLITGTRAFNAGSEGMLLYENRVKDFIEENRVRVLYRVTPVFSNDNLVAEGVLMEALSEDGRLCFNVFVYNVQPGIEIDYATGESRASQRKDAHDQEEKQTEAQSTCQEDSGQTTKTEADAKDELYQNTTTGLVTAQDETGYICNENTRKFHKPICKAVLDMKEKNKRRTEETRQQLIEEGYSPCKICNP